MENILNDTSSESIILAIEKNLADFYIKSSKNPYFSSYISSKISWVFAKDADWPSCIFRANFENFDMEYEIKNIIKLIQYGNAPNGWTIGPMTRPKDLGNFLETNGFSDVYHQSGMAINLEKIKNKSIEINDLTIKIIDSEENLKQWSKNVSLVFNIKIDFKLLEYLLLEKDTIFYIGIFNGKIVSTLLLFLSSGVAGLHAVTTLPEYRNKGFALTISRAALIDAFESGYRIGVLQASQIGERVYRKLGFKKYCDITSYELISGINRK